VRVRMCGSFGHTIVRCIWTVTVNFCLLKAEVKMRKLMKTYLCTHIRLHLTINKLKIKRFDENGWQIVGT